MNDPVDEPSSAALSGVVTITRTGGFAGLSMSGQVDLDGLDDDQRTVWTQALTEQQLVAAPHDGAPDRFVYRVCNEGSGLDLTVGDHEIPDELRALLDTALRPPTTC